MLTPLRYGNTNTYLIGGSRGTLLVDTDWAGTLPAFYRAIKAQKLRVGDITHVMATHFHPDHMGIMAELSELGVQMVIFDVQLPHVHFADRIFAREGKSTYKPIDESRAHILPCEESRAFLASIGIAGEVIPTPGHSEDSVSVILDDGIALVGDLPPHSILAATEDAQVHDSYKRLLARGVVTLHYGHMKSEQV